jgi:predicted Zn-dependent protease
MQVIIRRSIFKQLLLGVSMLALGACETIQTTQGGAVGVDRAQRVAISSEAIEQAASQQYAELLAQERRKGTLNRNPSQVQRVRTIVNRLIPQATVFRPDAREWNWEANVISAPEVNAWAMPGGKLGINTGLIEKLNLTDDELAAVLGHEIAHVLREHSREQASEQTLAGTGISIASAVLGLGDLGQKGLEYAYTGLRGLPMSRRAEVEADRIGVELAARAGYDPRAAVSLWAKMGEAAGGEPAFKFLSTHPAREDRLSDLRTYAQRVLPLYEQARATR